MSPLADFPATGKSARTTRTPVVFHGTKGSNPPPSSEESANFRSLSGERIGCGRPGRPTAGSLARANQMSMTLTNTDPSDSNNPAFSFWAAGCEDRTLTARAGDGTDAKIEPNFGS